MKHQKKITFFSLFVLILLTACSSSEKMETKMEPFAEKYAPGTAGVLAELIAVEVSENSNSCKIKVEKVLGYGPATPILTAKNYSINLSKNILNKLEGKYPDENKTYNFLLRFSEKMGESKGSWEIISIK